MNSDELFSSSSRAMFDVANGAAEGSLRCLKFCKVSDAANSFPFVVN